MKRFMRGGKESSTSRGIITSSTPTATTSATPNAATSATPTTNAAVMHVAPTQASRQASTKLAAEKQEAERQAATMKQTTTMKKAAALKQAAALKHAAPLKHAAAMKEAATRQEASTRQETDRQDDVRQEASRQTEEAHVEVEGANAEAEEHLVDPANEGKIELIPNVFWFSKPEVAAGVTESIKAHYNFPYMNWTEVPQTVRDRWFLEFKRHFTWKPEYNDSVRRDYEMKGSNRLKDSVNKAAKVPLHKQISWMSNNIRAEFIRKRKDPDFIKRSDKAKKNRYSNQSVTSFDPGHRQGSISTIEVAERLAAEKNGVLPLAADVYEKTHGFEMPDGENILIGDRSNKTMAEYVQKLAAYSDKGVTKPPNEVFLEVVGGRKKGKVYGLGSASSMFYEVGGPSQTKQSTPHVSMVAQLSSQLEDSKTMVEECKKMVEESKKIAEDSKKLVEDSLKVAKANQEAHEKEKSEWKKEKEELVANMAKVKNTVADVFQLLLQERSFKPHDPRGPPTDGGAP